ncbi:hypothetical protein B4109_0765 [Geobacillus stearothermophilus]|uniref:Uncharacterized protein n=1 Tax=Geobacillus stearothermophilus TaxID=1422 RepID=A0A150M8H7_GEOSE|nr:hypothetical protein B4109_0765 [Geobacillus stearothermophilus]
MFLILFYSGLGGKVTFLPDGKSNLQETEHPSRAEKWSGLSAEKTEPRYAIPYRRSSFAIDGTPKHEGFAPLLS